MNELDVFFNDEFSSVAVFGSDEFKVIFDMPDEVIGGGLVISTEYVATVKSEDIISLIDGDVIAVNGEDYEIRQIRKIDDGKLSKLFLSKV